MPDNQDSPDRTLAHLRVRARAAPLCYARQQRSDQVDRPPIDEQGSAVLLVLGALTCAAAFLVAYGGWV
jgi:hypothetical protein